MTATAFEITIKSIIEETDDARSFVLQFAEEDRASFAYSAGQFITLVIPWEGFTVQRCYSMSSAPCTDADVRITVKRVPQGRVSNWMIDTLGPGDVLQAHPPDGRFVLDESAPAHRPLTLLAAGSGITPVLSLLESALATTGRSVRLIYANRDADSIIFADQIQRIQAQHPTRFTLHEHLDSNHGFLTPGALQALLAGSAEGEFYVCGPTGFMDAVEAALDALRVDPSHAHFERFVSPVDPDRRVAVEEAPEVGVASPDDYTLVLDGRRHRVPYLPGQTLLGCAKAAGLQVPHSCEEGFCGSCMAQLVSGSVGMGTQEALRDTDVARGRVLLCRARPTGTDPVVVDYDGVSFQRTSTDADAPQTTPLSKARALVVLASGAALVMLVRALNA